MSAEDWILSTYRGVYGYLRRLCGCRAAAEDLTQETYMKAWGALGGYEGRSSLKTWLYRIAYHRFVDWQRRGKRREMKERGGEDWWEVEDPGRGPAQSAADRQLAERLYGLVEELDEDWRQVVHLHYYESLSLAETAAVLDCPLSTVKYRLRKALNSLKHKMDL